LGVVLQLPNLFLYFEGLLSIWGKLL